MGKGERLRGERKAKLAQEVEQKVRAEEAKRHAAIEGVRRGRRRGCLFCRQGDGGFTSFEHIFPEALGNTELLLPVGVVCDRCNNGPQAEVDEALSRFLPIDLLRTWHGIPSKSGKLPNFNFDNGALRCVRPGHIHLQLDSYKGQPKDSRGTAAHGASFSAWRNEGTPRRLRNVHRALLKMALEFAWTDLGEDEALGEDFDHLRERVIDGGHGGYLVFPEKMDPAEEISFQYERHDGFAPDHSVIAVMGRFWGFPLFTDSHHVKPTRPAPSGLILQTFEAAPQPASTERRAA
ncbi:MAG TPA: HNH endonuclease [Solirubrobacterales bacterium]|nr:HNH endonuclease [Solirubrobacterales bacterium]